MNEAQELLAMYSDLSKDVYGSRIRLDPNTPIEELRSDFQRLCEYSEFIFAEEEKIQNNNFENLLATIKNVSNICNCSNKKAIYFLMDAEDCHRKDYDYFCYLYNIPYSKASYLKSL